MSTGIAPPKRLAMMRFSYSLSPLVFFLRVEGFEHSITGFDYSSPLKCIIYDDCCKSGKLPAVIAKNNNLRMILSARQEPYFLIQELY